MQMGEKKGRTGKWESCFELCRELFWAM
jgi:hypothetical protein